ncbi:methylenetetrahydrofolate--tRNA-(uracil(54)-C(5))-methyltransferase (FADH(2)-oxidizing) TrmFO [Selenomonas sp. oral taxon 920]|uniref:methylenetetrahydrofolate--tRNA-(uracil(54)- C(5))-methyltransferase (FADH(2)-oxidizing) TrmFO n=1 Tax=Selenomonas sp. oral taxon 920 TaxID=1884263 RepID=UPI000840D025|nr:methylenetetrahydrofolate--tRNA-(uracil(54)-C(5))-methyltransferase (FADH(2)-oxidizing) TrmFO [Selenomonas sp. oral taxon 920]AOH47995.1 methylenetetrahydrofolate--tRNA-(uracil(54)-C(5))-methyltransferase (FADH(2)-oxidizing) TrmFO [Selenomonas sp. oral taxon 920]
MKKVIVIGAGLAGSEAAWQAAEHGAQVTLFEMRPLRSTPAHKTDGFAELVCSNSLRGAGLENAVGVLKEEMRRMRSLIMQAADATAVPAGGALAVDRTKFSDYVTARIKQHSNITVQHEEITQIPSTDEAIVIIASGPLTDGALSAEIAALLGNDSFYFYDAAAPLVTASSIDMMHAYRASRYGKGDAAYINCPMNEEQYEAFYAALTTAETAQAHDFEKEIFFEGCMPVEVMAARGKDTLLYGPLKPVGLEHPETGVRPYAVVQLRQDNAEGTIYNMVGFQTRLKWPEQQRVFRMIPGLTNAEFLRYGVMHRNSFINAPRHLRSTFQLRINERLFFAGQMTGVEGYVESAASGLMAGVNAARLAGNGEPLVFPSKTCHGALAHYITSCDPMHFQPMNINFGLLPPLAHLPRRTRKPEKKRLLAQRALEELDCFGRSI